jgi:hypothetical protein
VVKNSFFWDINNIILVKKEATCSSKMSFDFHWTSECYIPEDIYSFSSFYSLPIAIFNHTEVILKARRDGFLKCAKLFIFFNNFREIFIMGVDKICICKEIFELQNLMKCVYRKSVSSKPLSFLDCLIRILYCPPTLCTE